jgi:hypothetical protein
MENLATSLRNLLAHNIVRFTFRKVDGTIRKAIGTRNLNLARQMTKAEIPSPKGEEQPNSYFDIERMGWRSYKPNNLVSIDAIVDMGELMISEIFSKIPTPTAETTPKQREIKVELPPSFGKGTEEKIRKEIDKLGSDIEIPLGSVMGGLGGGMPIFGGGMPMGGGVGGKMPMGGKVGQPTDVGYGMALPISGIGEGKEMTIEDFAKMVAKYVVAELIDRLTK